MILLDEIDVKEKEKRESLPPYSPRSLGHQASATDTQLSSRVLHHTQEFLHPRSASLSVPRSRSQYTLVSAYSDSTQTLVPQVPTTAVSIPSPSTSQLDIPKYAITLAPLSVHRTGPPPHLRAANNVYVQRETASITGAFAIDPALFVPDCLLPDDPDVLLVDGMPSAKGKGKRANLCLVTRSGDICVDVWVRKGCATRGRKNAGKRREGGSGSHRSDFQEVEGDEDYWADGWTSPPPSKPFPLKTSSRVDIDIQSESGSITLRLHAQSHQRLRIHLSSAHGSVSIGVPRSFVGYVYANDSSDLHMRGMSSSTIHLPSGGPDGWDTERGDGGSLDGQPAITPRQPVQFTEEMEDIVTPEVERRKAAMGRYFVGNKSQIFSEHMGTINFDELYIESRRGNIGVSFNDEAPQQKQRLITKLLSKAW